MLQSKGMLADPFERLDSISFPARSNALFVSIHEQFLASSMAYMLEMKEVRYSKLHKLAREPLSAPLPSTLFCPGTATFTQITQPTSSDTRRRVQGPLST